jgi:hypothetical protein
VSESRDPFRDLGELDSGSALASSPGRDDLPGAPPALDALFPHDRLADLVELPIPDKPDRAVAGGEALAESLLVAEHPLGKTGRDAGRAFVLLRR